MALIPKINIGTPVRRSPNNWSCDSQTTANIGFVQPTYARLVPNDSSITFKDSTIVRMSPLVNPTFGRLSLRDYYRFVRMTDVYKPWNDFRSKKNFTTSDDVSYIPTELPKFYMADMVFSIILANSYISVSPHDAPTTALHALSDNNVRTFLTLFIPKLFEWSPFDIAGLAYDGDNYSQIMIANEAQKDDPFSYGTFLWISEEGETVSTFRTATGFGHHMHARDLAAVNYENSDFTFFIPSSFFSDVPEIMIQGNTGNEIHFDPVSDGCYLHFRLKIGAKNMRKILIGLGYQFNPFDKKPKTPFALLAYYKAFFDEFVPQRNIQFTDTPAYRIIKNIEELDSTWRIRFIEWASTNLLKDFYYYTQPDYFSASLYNLGDNSLYNGQENKVIFPYDGDINQYNNNEVRTNLKENAVFGTSNGLATLTNYGRNGDSNFSVRANSTPSTNQQSPDGTVLNSKSAIDSFFNLNGLTLQVAMKLLRFTNKNNVIGRNIREYLKVHYGLDDAQLESNISTKINANKLDINFFDVMNQTESSDAFLGEFAGQGYGARDMKDKNNVPTYFDTKDWGFFICMTVLVPETGYYQGSLRENEITTTEEFLSQEYDAIGFEVINRSEILNDYHVYKKTDYLGSKLPCDTDKGFGFIPRYTFHKIAKNIVNGDLSLHSTKNGLQGYFLDKQFPTVKERYAGDDVLEFITPAFEPNVVSDNIRKVDPSDTIGNYNRIFQYTNVDMDHFIIQKVLDIEVRAPWKSVKDSFDTVQQDEKVIERNHQ